MISSRSLVFGPWPTPLAQRPWLAVYSNSDGLGCLPLGFYFDCGLIVLVLLLDVLVGINAWQASMLVSAFQRMSWAGHERKLLLQGIKSKYGLQDAAKVRKEAIFSMVRSCCSFVSLQGNLRQNVLN